MTTVAKIQRAVADRAGISVTELLSYRRKHAGQRQLAMFLSRELTTCSYPQIGRAFGRDRTTILYGCQVIEAAIPADGELAHRIQALAAALTTTSED